MNTALVLEDNTQSAEAIGRAVESMGFEVSVASTLADARTILSTLAPGLILMDINLPDGSGLALVEELDLSSRSKVIFITGDQSQNTAIDCMRLHAADVLQKPFDVTQLRDALRRCEITPQIDLRSPDSIDSAERAANDGRIGSIQIIDGVSRASVELRKLVKLASQEPFSTALLEGNAGSGKTSVARLIHKASGGSGKAVTLDCAALQPLDQAHIEMFGEVDSDTGKILHRGHVERAAAGTLILDNLTELPLAIQARLISIVDTGLFLRTNALTLTRSKPRIIGIARSDVLEAVAEGKIRQDFLDRMSRFHIRVPNLTQRRSDIGMFALAFLEELNSEHGTRGSLSKETLVRVEEAPWHGNLPELRDTLERSLLSSSGDADLVLGEISALRHNDLEMSVLERRYVGGSLWDVQRDLLFSTLSHYDGDKVKAAESLGISLKTLYNRLRDYQ